MAPTKSSAPDLVSEAMMSPESGRSRSSDLHRNERHQRDHRYNPNRAYPDSRLEYGPDRFASRCHCADDNNREGKRDVAHRY